LLCVILLSNKGYFFLKLAFFTFCLCTIKC
jgi:hypothetical protein